MKNKKEDITNNYFLNLVKERKTTYEFNTKPVDIISINKILEAGRWAPSCNNTQPWHFVVIKDKATIKKLMMTATYGDFHIDPPLMIALILLKDQCPGEGYSCFRGKVSNTNESFICVGMAGLNMVLEATDLKIDSCILTPTEETVKKILKVKDKDAVPLIIGLGYQKEKTFQKKRERKKLSEITSYEYFGGRNE